MPIYTPPHLTATVAVGWSKHYVEDRQHPAVCLAGQ